MDDVIQQIILDNAARDSDYCPYCMRCCGMVRMRKAGPLHWYCDCGAECDLTDQNIAAHEPQE